MLRFILICAFFFFFFLKQVECFRSEGELALGLFVTRSRVAGLDKMSPDCQGGFYLLVLGADNSEIAIV